jgi:hypothetical protein
MHIVYTAYAYYLVSERHLNLTETINSSNSSINSINGGGWFACCVRSCSWGSLHQIIPGIQVEEVFGVVDRDDCGA